MEIHTEVKSELNKTLLSLRSGHYGSRLSDTEATDEQIKGVLPVAIRGEGEMTVYEYEITVWYQ